MLFFKNQKTLCDHTLKKYCYLNKKGEIQEEVRYKKKNFPKWFLKFKNIF